MAVPKSRTPRDLLLAALERRRLTGYCASQDLAWVVFPPQQEGGARVEVIHLPRANRFRVVSSATSQSSTAPATTLGTFRSSEAAAACVQDALAAVDAAGHADPGQPAANTPVEGTPSRTDA
jgi:hypothetical protein